MFKKAKIIMLMGLCGAFLTTALPAEELSKEQKRVEVGLRAEPLAKRMAREKERVEKVKEEKKGTKKPQLDKSVESLKKFAKGVYYTSHPGAYQNPVSISYFGDTVELMDGSIWAIAASDAYKVVNWLPTDAVVITANHNWFSSYSFRLTNQNTGDAAVCNLYLGPIDPMYNSIYTHWITAIDYYYDVVYLEDGSRWDISAFDSKVISNWMPNDVVIIGVNDGWLSYSNPNILINVNMLNYAAGSASY